MGEDEGDGLAESADGQAKGQFNSNLELREGQ